MQNISGYGLEAYIIASSTFPVGFSVTQFADDADPLDMSSITIAETFMGLNGDMLTAAKAVTIPVVLNVVPQSNDDSTLGILMQANMVQLGQNGARDEITMTLTYPDGRIATLTSGVMTEGMPSQSVASSGRLKSKQYSFAFGKIVWE